MNRILKLGLVNWYSVKIDISISKWKKKSLDVMVCLYIEIHFLSYDTKKSSIILLIFSCPELSISLLCRVLILWGFYNVDFSQNFLNTLFLSNVFWSCAFIHIKLDSVENSLWGNGEKIKVHWSCLIIIYL